MNTGARTRWIARVGLLLLVASGCNDAVRTVIVSPDQGATPPEQTNIEAPLFVDRDVDLLFMIDNSNSMEQEQKLLAKQFPKLIEVLRSSKLGPVGCTTNCRIPNLHVGIVTSDLGAGSYNLPSCETAGGDGGKLIYAPRVRTGCATPKDKWISYTDGTSNVTDLSTTDEVTKVEDAFACLAEVGTGGCGFEHQLESPKKALDENVNPGFMRNDPRNNKDAFLVVVLLTDEDDCSAQNTKLYDPAQTGLTDPLGPLTSFRCFEFGITCQPQSNLRTNYGTRTSCVPKTGSGSYLYEPQRYIDFFKNLKKGPTGEAAPGRILVAAIAGPTDHVEVGTDGSYPVLKQSCTSSLGEAVPAIRIEAVTDGLGDQGQFTSLCTTDLSSAFKKIADRVIASFGAMCLKAPVLTSSGSIVCQKGDVLSSTDSTRVCKASCLDQADCTVSEIAASTGKEAEIGRCPAALFHDVIEDCGASCPCWRIVKSTECKPASGSSPYALEILRAGEAAQGTYAKFSCRTSTARWGEDAFAALGQCL
jgi:hypothetical protein